MKVTQYLFMELYLMKIHLSLVISSGIIVHHLATENQVPEFALNWREWIRNVDQKVIFWGLVLRSSTRFQIWPLESVKQMCQNEKDTRMSCSSCRNVFAH